MEIDCGSRVVSLGDGQTDMKKLTVVFRNFANAPKNGVLSTVKPDKAPPSLRAHESL
jgi:hypothetical protein